MSEANRTLFLIALMGPHAITGYIKHMSTGKLIHTFDELRSFITASNAPRFVEVHIPMDTGANVEPRLVAVSVIAQIYAHPDPVGFYRSFNQPSVPIDLEQP